MKTRSTYTSSEYGYSVDYTEFHPSRQDNSSVEWDLSSDSGQYAIQVLAAPPRGRNARQIVNSIIDNNFSDYNLVYEITGAEVGYTPGAGGVWDDEVAPFFGSASDTRLVVLVAEKKNLAIAVVATGDAGDTQSDHPNPSGLPVASFVDSITNGSRWPGDPRR
jgi:hypothetical protein